jgi:hypothetical protein
VKWLSGCKYVGPETEERSLSEDVTKERIEDLDCVSALYSVIITCVLKYTVNRSVCIHTRHAFLSLSVASCCVFI